MTCSVQESVSKSGTIQLRRSNNLLVWYGLVSNISIICHEDSMSQAGAPPSPQVLEREDTWSSEEPS